MVTISDAPDRIDIDGGAILRAIEAQHGILVEQARGVYSFAHPTFQEYYTARYVVDNALEGALPKLLVHAYEDRWREVIMLAASMFPNADAFFEVFLKRLDAMAKGDNKLVAFLGWVERKAASVDARYKPAAVRAYYAWLALALDHASTRPFDFDPEFRFYGSARVNGRIRAACRARARDLALDLALASGLDPALISGLDLALVSALASAIVSTLTRPLDINYALDINYDFDIDLACDMDKTALHTELSKLTVPDEDASYETRWAFVAQLRAIMIEHRDIGHDWDWGFTEEPADYFGAVELLIECLDVAYVTNRAAIEDLLLLPPAVE
jgi:hypothetical protein